MSELHITDPRERKVTKANELIQKSRFSLSPGTRISRSINFP